VKYKALIIDDEPLACGLVAKYLNAFPEIVVVEQCYNGFEGLKAFQSHQPHLVFLDVQMPKLSGLELVELLDPRPAIIFTTAFDQYAMQAFEAQAVDYLLKPFSEERFKQAVRKFLESPQRSFPADFEPPASSDTLQRLVVKEGAQLFLIPYRKIHRLEADGDYTRIFTEEGKFMKKKGLLSFEKNLPADLFVRVHRSHLINVSKLKRIDPYGKNDHIALLQNGEQVPVSRSGFKALKKVLQL